MTGFLAAFGFLTTLPVGKRALEQKSLAGSAAYFPLVGLVLGLALAGADYGLRIAFDGSLILPSALTITLLMLLTGALHFEGFVDACDGLFGGHSRERRLEIMRDKRVGAYAVAGGVLLLILKFAAIASLPDNTSRFCVIAVFPILSRWGMSLLLGVFPYVRQQGLGTAFRGTNIVQVVAAGIIGIIAALVIGSIGGIILFAVATSLAWLMGFIISRLLGGLTGDIYGAINEFIEAILLIVSIVLINHIAVLPLWQELL